jgi:hypothetical protein
MSSENKQDNYMFADQKNWFSLCGELGEQEARNFLVCKLRETADQIERGGMPDVFGCRLTEPDIFPMRTVSVTLSDVWPG